MTTTTTAPAENVSDLAVCGCCLVALANGDTSGHEFACGDSPEPLCLLGGDLVPDGEELGFSWSACEGCGALAGDRFRVLEFSPA